MGKLGIHHGDEQAVAVEAFDVFVGLVLSEASVHEGIDDLLEAAYAVHGCSPDVFELALWVLPVKTLGCNLFVWVGDFYSGQ